MLAFRFLALGLAFLLVSVITRKWGLAVVGVPIVLPAALVMWRRGLRDRALGRPDTPIPGRDLLVRLSLRHGDAPGATVEVPVVRQEACFMCHGGGKASIGGDCAVCSGTGRMPVERHLKLKLPEDVRDGMRIKIVGKGEPGLGGGPAGNLYVQFEKGVGD